MDDRNLTVSITLGTVLKTVGILVLAWLLFELRGVVLIVLTAVVISSAVEPGVRSIMRSKVPRVLAVLLIYVLLIGFAIIMLYFFFPSVLKDFATFIASLPSYIDTFTSSSAYSAYANILGLPDASTISSADIT